MSYSGLFSLKDKVALVVGAAGGLAGETCLGLAAFGAKLALADRSAEGLAAVSAMLNSRGISSWGQSVDISDQSSVSSLLSSLHDEFGRIDIMINFAGLAAPLQIEQIDAKEFQRIVQVNLLGSFLLAKHSLQYMVPQGSGKIILLGSVQGQIGRPFSSHYSASKGGIQSMTRTLAVEMAKKNIQVNSVAPVFTLTPMSAPVVARSVELVWTLASLSWIGGQVSIRPVYCTEKSWAEKLEDADAGQQSLGRHNGGTLCSEQRRWEGMR